MTPRIGIIGYGRIGALHAHWLREAPLAPAIVFDPTPARRELAQRADLRTSDSIDELLGDESIDAVVVSTPTSMHFDHASAALRAGKHVMVEKPMTIDLDQAQRLVELARRQQRVLSVFHNRRWDPDFLALRRAIDDGVFGRVFNVESRLGQWESCVGPAAREWRPQWRNEASFGGGGLYDWGSHFLDQVWRLLHPARPLRVFAQLRGNVWSSDCDDLARICIDFDDGATALVEINTTTKQPLPRWHIDGTTGSASSPFDLRFNTETWAQLRFLPCDGGAERMLPRGEAGLRPSQMWQRFAAACRGEGEPAVRAESVLPTMALLDAARASSAGGQVVRLSETVHWTL
jgi:predicted dehydrogenase